MTKTKITEKQYQEAYQLAKSVFENTLERNKAIAELNQTYGMQINSAKFYLNSLNGLLSGTKFRETIQDAAADYYLKTILSDFGKERLELALHSIKAHTDEYESKRKSKRKKHREIIEKYEKILIQQKHDKKNPLLDHFEELEKQVKTSLKMDNKTRQTNLKKHPTTPEKISIQTTVFKRNPHVIAEVLLRANGNCESCKKSAPFKRASDQTPYLEVHHKIKLAVGGEDTVANAEALCPNCHREKHFGEKIKTI